MPAPCPLRIRWIQRSGFVYLMHAQLPICRLNKLARAAAQLCRARQSRDYLSPYCSRSSLSLQRSQVGQRARVTFNPAPDDLVIERAPEEIARIGGRYGDRGITQLGWDAVYIERSRMAGSLGLSGGSDSCLHVGSRGVRLAFSIWWIFVISVKGLAAGRLSGEMRGEGTLCRVGPLVSAWRPWTCP
eukprot:6200268-Pleurochrysis_carterae.AAC.1